MNGRHRRASHRWRPGRPGPFPDSLSPRAHPTAQLRGSGTRARKFETIHLRTATARRTTAPQRSCPEQRTRWRRPRPARRGSPARPGQARSGTGPADPEAPAPPAGDSSPPGGAAPPNDGAARRRWLRAWRRAVPSDRSGASTAVGQPGRGYCGAGRGRSAGLSPARGRSGHDQARLAPHRRSSVTDVRSY